MARSDEPGRSPGKARRTPAKPPADGKARRTPAKRSADGAGKPRATRTAKSKKSEADKVVTSVEAPVEKVEQTRELLRLTARGALGVTGDLKAATPPLRESIKRSGVGWYPLLALGALVIVDEFQGYAYFVLGPEIAESLGISKGAIAFTAALKVIAISLATLPIAAFAQKKARRGMIAVVTAYSWSVMTMATGFVTSFAGLMLVLMADGASSGSTRAVHRPLLFDSYPPEVRVRADSSYRMADSLGNILAPLTVGLLTAVLGFTWRGVFLTMGLMSLGAALLASRLRDPGFGRWDTGRVRQIVREHEGKEEKDEDEILEEEVALGFFEIVRRLLLIPTVRRILVGDAVFGMFLIPLYTFIFFFFEERWGMGPGARSLLFATFPFYAMAALYWGGRRGERMFREDPGKLLVFSAQAQVVAVLGIVLSVMSPWFVPMAILFGIAVAAFGVLNPMLAVAMLSVVPPRMRPHAAALKGIAIAAVGGFGGLILLGGIDSRFGTGVAIMSLGLPGIIASLVLYKARTGVSNDLDRLIDEIVEEEEVRSLHESGVRLPMLASRNIDFSYGQLQVLFDVSFTVDDGELVALLGTNGAGKSTLLRVISGLGLPTRGSVRYRGVDVTYLDAERRMRLGITQIPGGRAVFRNLSVTENLKLFGYTHAKDRARLEKGIETTFEAFPRLYERRDQAASTLSGGEQQMLGLGKAFILRPKLLLIDELSLGLAPKIVSELLEMVRRINAEGTAVVLVEQSVNVALSIAQHAYFMEKGEIRFDGRSEDLLARGDLLRSVFLEGAAKGLKR